MLEQFPACILKTIAQLYMIPLQSYKGSVVLFFSWEKIWWWVSVSQFSELYNRIGSWKLAIAENQEHYFTCLVSRAK